MGTEVLLNKVAEQEIRTAIINDTNAAVLISQGDNVRSTTTILVTAENGVTKQTYMVEFT